MLEKEEKTHSHRQQKSSSFNPYAEKLKGEVKKINETNKIKWRHVCRMYLCSGFFYRQKKGVSTKKNKKLLFYNLLYVNKFEVTRVFTFSYLIFFEWYKIGRMAGGKSYRYNLYNLCSFAYTNLCKLYRVMRYNVNPILSMQSWFICFQIKILDDHKTDPDKGVFW